MEGTGRSWAMKASGPGAPSSVLAPSSFLLLAMPGAPSSVVARGPWNPLFR